MEITKDVKALRKIMPTAIITAEPNEKYVKYTCDLRHAKISPEQHDDLFPPIKELFGERLMERLSHHTGYFDVFVIHEKELTSFN